MNGTSYNAVAGTFPRPRTLGRVRWPLNNALNQSTSALAIFDSDLRCRASNQAFAAMTKVSVRHHLGRTLDQILGVAVPQFQVALRQVWRAKQTLREQRIDAKTASGTERIWLVDCFPLQDLNGGLRMVGAVFSELTARNRIEQRLQRLASQSPHSTEGEDAPHATGGDLPEGYLELMGETVNLLNRSMALRRAVSEIRVASSLHRYSLMLATDDLGDAIEALQRHGPQPGPTDATEDGTAQSSKSDHGLSANQPSPRELQVVHFLAEGKSNKEIAYFLRLSTRTVETYRSRLMAKLKVHSAAEVVRYAIRNNLIQA